MKTLHFVELYYGNHNNTIVFSCLLDVQHDSTMVFFEVLWSTMKISWYMNMVVIYHGAEYQKLKWIIK